MSDKLEHYKRGHGHYGQNEFVEAIAAYREALAIDPDWSDCLQALGMAQMQKGDLDDALKTMLRATELTPEDPFAFTSLSMIYVRREQIEEAEKAQATAKMLQWKEEVKTNPNAPPPHDGPFMGTGS